MDDLIQALGSARESAMTEYPEGTHTRAWFTDNVAIAFPVDLVGEAAIAVSLTELMAARLQMEMAMRGFLFSGGIALGPAYVQEDFVFGRAIVEAVKLEDVERKHSGGLLPRVLLTAQAAACESAGKAGFLGAMQRIGRSVDDATVVDLELRRTDGALTFVSHLDWMMLEHRVFQWSDDALFARLELHRDCIVAALQDDSMTDKVQRKYLWLAEYHDEFCRRHLKSEVAAPLILNLT